MSESRASTTDEKDTVVGETKLQGGFFTHKKTQETEESSGTLGDKEDKLPAVSFFALFRLVISFTVYVL